MITGETHAQDFGLCIKIAIFRKKIQKQGIWMLWK